MASNAAPPWTKREVPGYEGAYYFTDSTGRLVTWDSSPPRWFPQHPRRTRQQQLDAPWYGYARMGDAPLIQQDSGGQSLFQSALEGIYNLRFPLAVLSAGGVFALGGAAEGGSGAGGAAAAESGGEVAVEELWFEGAPDVAFEGADAAANLDIVGAEAVDWNALGSSWEGAVAESAAQNAELAALSSSSEFWSGARDVGMRLVPRLFSEYLASQRGSSSTRSSAQRVPMMAPAGAPSPFGAPRASGAGVPAELTNTLLLIGAGVLAVILLRKAMA